MKCPFRIGNAPYDGGEECSNECAWLVKVYECSAEPQILCAMALNGNPMDCPRKPLNTVEVEDE